MAPSCNEDKRRSSGVHIERRSCNGKQECRARHFRGDRSSRSSANGPVRGIDSEVASASPRPLVLRSARGHARNAQTDMQRKNIDELPEDLNRKFHSLRQSGIDEELFDVVSGFEALTRR